MSYNGINNQIYNNDFTVQKTGNGTTVTSTIQQTSNTASATAKRLISVAGGTAGDAFTNYAIDGITNWSEGIDNSDSDAFVIAASNALGTTNVAHCRATTGEWTYPLQPAVQAYFTAPTANNLTGDGTAYTVIFDGEYEDIGGNYNNTTGIFTCPVAGTYLVCGSIQAANLGAGHTAGQILMTTTVASFNCINANYAAIRDSSNTVGLSFSMLHALSAGNTIKLELTVSGSTKTVGVNSGNLGIFLLG